MAPEDLRTRTALHACTLRRPRRETAVRMRRPPVDQEQDQAISGSRRRPGHGKGRPWTRWNARMCGVEPVQVHLHAPWARGVAVTTASIKLHPWLQPMPSRASTMCVNAGCAHLRHATRRPRKPPGSQDIYIYIYIDIDIDICMSPQAVWFTRRESERGELIALAPRGKRWPPGACWRAQRRQRPVNGGRQ